MRAMYVHLSAGRCGRPSAVPLGRHVHSDRLQAYLTCGYSRACARALADVTNVMNPYTPDVRKVYLYNGKRGIVQVKQRHDWRRAACRSDSVQLNAILGAGVQLNEIGVHPHRCTWPCSVHVVT